MDKTELIRLFDPLSNEFATDPAPWDEIRSLSEVFGYDFGSLLRQIDGEWYFVPIVDLWNNLSQLPRINDNEHPPDSAEAFQFFYPLALGRAVPRHNLAWIEQAYRTHREGKSLLIEAHRESNKTSLCEALLAFKLGLYPTTTNMLVRGSAEAARDSGKHVAHMVSENLAFTKVFFPYIKPDVGGSPVPQREGGTWNISAYNVRDTRIPEVEAAQLSAQRQGWSVMVFSPQSGAIRGRRVNGVLLLDDLVVAKQTGSDAEMQHLITEVNRAVLNTRVEGSLTIVLGTPQRADDLLERMLKAGGYDYIRQPLVNEDGSINWPARFSPDEVYKREHDIEEGRGYQTEYQLDRTALTSQEFAGWLTFPAGKIDTTRMMLLGALDPATYSATGGRNSQSHAALILFGIEPATAIWVVTGAWVGQLDRASLIDRIATQRQIYPTLTIIGIEEDGIGGEIVADMGRYHPDFKVWPLATKGVSKKDRTAVYLKPLLAQGKLRISDAADDGLKQVRDAVTLYPVNTRSHYQDIIDALTWAAYMIYQGGGRDLLRPKRATNIPWYQQLAEMR